MNQSILFNDDLKYDEGREGWQFTGLLSGQLITIIIHGNETTITDHVKFDLEAQVEEWLEDNEPDEANVIVIT